MLERLSQQTAQDYQAFSEILTASERGRAFLDEHARRSRGADNERLMAGISRIEASLRANATVAEPLRAELTALLAILRRARPEIAASALPVRAAKLAVLFELMERRIAALAVPATPPLPMEPGLTCLAVVPAPDKPQLPIPSPAASEPPPVVLAKPATKPDAESAKCIPEVNWHYDAPHKDADSASTQAGQPDNAVKVAIAQILETSVSKPASPPTKPYLPAGEEKPLEPSAAKPAPPPADPLAPIMLLSEEERIALFT